LKKKIVSILIAALVVAVCAPIVTHADEPVYTVTPPVEYTSLIFKTWSQLNKDDTSSGANEKEYELLLGDAVALSTLYDALNVPNALRTGNATSSAEDCFETFAGTDSEIYVRAIKGFAEEQTLELKAGDARKVRVFTRVSTSYSKTRFRYGNSTTDLYVGSTTALTDILTAMGIQGTSIESPVSSIAAVSLTDTPEGWTVSSTAEFETEQTLSVTVDGNNYNISIFTVVGGTWRNFDKDIMHWNLTIYTGSLYVGGNGKLNTDTTNETDLRGDSSYGVEVPYNNMFNGENGFTFKGSKEMVFTPWRAYETKAKHVTVEPGVTAIGSRVFSGSTKLNTTKVLETIVFQNKDSLTKIGAGAFKNCYGLVSIDLSGCYNLVELDGIGDSGKLGVFESCRNLVSIDLSGCTSLERIGDRCFADCRYLNEVNLTGCTNLKEISNSAIQMINDNGTKLFNPIDLSANTQLSTISELAFQNNNGIVNLDLSGNVNLVHIGKNAFSVANNTFVTRLESVDLSNCVNLKTIGENAFSLPSGVTATLRSVDLSGCDSLNIIRSKTFANQSALQTLSLPANITTIASDAFSGCSSLETLIWDIKSYSSPIAGIFPNVTHLYIGEDVESLHSDFFDSFSENAVVNFAPRTENQIIWMKFKWDSDEYRQYRIDERGHVYRYPEDIEIYPAVSALIEQEPRALDLSYTGSAQDLISAGSAVLESTMEYRLGLDGRWSADIPTATEAGTYSVYFRAYENDDITHIQDGTEPIVVKIQPVANPAVIDTSTIYMNPNSSVDVSTRVLEVPEETTSVRYEFTYGDIGSINSTTGILTSKSISATHFVRIVLGASQNYKETKINIPVHINSTMRVTFMDGQMVLSEQNIIYGGKIALPEEPVKEGFAFNGWTIDGEPFDTNLSIVRDTVLVASWKNGITPSVQISGWTYGEYDELINSPAVTGNTGNGDTSFYYKVKDADDKTYTPFVPINAGTYTLLATIAETDEYAGASVSTDFVIEPREVGLTWNQTVLTYTTWPQVPTVSVSNLLGSDVCEVTVTGEATNVGHYTAVASSLSNPNYKLPEINSQDFSIEPKGVYVTGITASDKVYDGTTDAEMNADPSVVHGVISGESVDVIVTARFENSNYGNDKTVEIISIELTGKQSSNYTLLDGQTQTSATASILRRPLTISARNQTIRASEPEIDLTLFDVVGLAEGHTLESVTISCDDIHNNGVISVGNDAVIKDADDSDVTSNYDITCVNGVVYVTNLELPAATVTAKDDLEYNGQDLVLINTDPTVTFASAGCEIRYSLDPSAETGSYLASSHAAKNAGTHRVYYIVIGDGTVYGDLAPQFIDVTISPKPITITWKSDTLALEYTRSVAYQAPTATTTDIVEGDSFEITVEGYGRDAGTYRATATALTGTDSDNYVLDADPANRSTDFTITKKPIYVVTGITALDKVYDHTADAEFDYYDVEFSGKEPQDLVSITAAGHFHQFEVGTDIEVTIDEITLTGTKADNYEINYVDSQHTSHASITQRPVTIEWGDTELVYNGVAQVPSVIVIGFITGDSGAVEVTGSGEHKNVGEYTATASSIENPNYMPTDAIETTFTIIRAPIIISNIKANDKVFDQTNAVTFDTTNVSFGGKYESDSLEITALSGRFEDIDAAEDKTIIIDVLTLGGADIDNYVLDETNSQWYATATIIPQTVVLIWSSTTDLVYNGEEQGPTVTVEGDLCDVTYEGKHTDAGTYTATATALSDPNYQIPSASTVTYIIEKRELTVAGIKGQTKEYDRTTDAPLNYDDLVLDGKVSGDDVSVAATGTYADWNVELGKELTITDITLTGSKSNNYRLAASGQQATATGIITEKILGITWENLEFEYDGSSHIPTAIATGVIEGDTCSINVEGANINAGNHAATAISTTNANYAVPAANTTPYTINKRALTIQALNQSVEINGAIGTDITYINVDGLIDRDTLEYFSLISSDTSHATTNGEIIPSDALITFGETNVTDNYTISYINGILTVTKAQPTYTAPTGLVLTYNGTEQILVAGGHTDNGTLKYSFSPDSGFTIETPTRLNADTYTLYFMIDGGEDYDSVDPQPITATINPKTVIINWGSTEFTYNGTNQIPTATLTNLEEGDECGFTISGAAKNAGTHTATISALSNTNYTLSSSISQAFIIAKKIVTVSGITAQDKNYDGTTAATLDYTGATVSELFAGDSLTISAVGTFADAKVGNNKTVNISNITLSGNNNYALANSGNQTQTTASILEAPAPAATVTITFAPNGGEGSMKKITVNAGSKYKLPRCTFYPPEGKEFYRWDAGNVGDEITVSTNTIITAVWKTVVVKTWTVTLMDGYGETIEYTVADGDGFVLPECTFTAPEGMQFSRWDKGEPGTIIPIVRDTVIKAMWRKTIEPTVWTVTLSDGYGNSQRYSVNDGDKFVLPECTFPAPSGMIFSKWSNGVPGESITVTADITVTAVWVTNPEPTEWTVTLSDGYGSYKEYLVADGAIYILPECPFTAPEGKEFSRWSNGIPGASIKITSNITITAIWTNILPEEWLITLFDGSSDTQIHTIKRGERFTLPSCPFTAPNGMEFVRWNMGYPGTTVEIHSNITITAIWEQIPPATWNVTLYSGYGVTQIFTVIDGQIFILPECPFIAPAEMEFDRWDNGEIGQAFQITSDTAFIALWKSTRSGSDNYYTYDGEAQIIDVRNDSEATFSVKQYAKDEETFDKFVGIEVDNVWVSEDNYTATRGSVVVTLSKDYIKSLAAGEHTLTFDFIDGDHSISFTIEGTKGKETLPLPMIICIASVVIAFLVGLIIISAPMKPNSKRHA
jgi:hypothetical protein